MCMFVSICLHVRVCACWVETEGGSGGTDGSWSALVWCSLPAKDQAKTVTVLSPKFNPTLLDRPKYQTSFSFINSFMSYQHVMVEATENDIYSRFCFVSLTDLI